MAYQAIVTKYLGATNSRGARVKATAAAGSLTVSWDHSLNVGGNHRAAAEALARKYGWVGEYVGGEMPEGAGNVYVCVSGAVEPGFTIEA